jgi:hypothetical protein
MDMLWSGWGDPAKAAPLTETVTGLLRDLLGVKPRTAGPIALADLAVPESRLEPAAHQALSAAVGGEEHVRTDAEARVRHTRGKSTPDLLRIRAGEVDDLPAAVVLPADHDEVLAVLRGCAEHGLPVVPFGGGTSVVGGLAPGRRGSFVALDLRRMNQLLALDKVSRTATLAPGLRAPEAEALLAEHGFTLGHFPQSYEWATIGGFAATRSSGQASAGYGRFDEMVLGLTHRPRPARRDRRRAAVRGRMHRDRRVRRHGRGHLVPQGAGRGRPARVRRHPAGRGTGTALGARPLLGPLSPGRPAGRGGVRRDAGDGDVLVTRPRAVRVRP